MANILLITRIVLIAVLALSSPLAVAGIDPATLTPPPVFGNYQAKGFLSDYSNIRPEGGESKAFVYRNPAIDRTRYRKIMIDPIKVWTKRDAWPRKGSPIFGELADYFHQAILSAIGDTMPIVNTPGPDVLRLRIAVTDLEPNDPGVSLITLIVPLLWLGEASAGVAQGDVGSTPFAGQVVVEMEALDSQSNAQVEAYIERRAGKKYSWDEGISTGLTSYMKGFFTWAYTEDAFNRWANLLRAELRPDQIISAH
jgi:hypothetical protein